jgi:hypothetical protein
MYEVKGQDISSYFAFEYLMAINFWKEKEHFGLVCDWRKFTVQQKKLIMLFDELKDKEVNRGRH